MSDNPMRAASYLPEDIQIQILSRSLAKTLIRFRCVSKRWCSLICDPQFVQLHLTRSVLLNRENLFIAPNKIFDDRPVGGSISYLYYVGTCNGLICLCIGKEQLVVFNPSTRCYKELPLPAEIDLYEFETHWGFGYDSTIDDYKVVLCLNQLSSTSNIPNEFMILNFKDNYWRRFRRTTQTYMISRYNLNSAVFLNGCLHWLGQANSRMIILSFDLSSEKFKEIPGPAELPDPSDIGMVGGCLWVSKPHWNGSKYVMNVWGMKEYNVQASWVKILELCLVFGERVLLLRNGEILVAQAGKELVAYNLLDGSKWKLIEVPRKDIRVIPYTESLISPDCGEDWKASKTSLDFMAEKVAILNVETLCFPNNV